MFRTNDKLHHVHDFYPSRRFGEACKLENQDHFKFAIVRDPVSRILSCYANRVEYYCELSEGKLDSRAIEAGLCYDPSLSYFIRNLDGYRQYSPSIKHHTEPLTFFLGDEPEYYDKIYQIGDIAILKSDLEGRLGKTLRIPREQTSGQKIHPDALSTEELEIVHDRYSSDYKAFYLNRA
jgi:hypothetical protein